MRDLSPQEKTIMQIVWNAGDDYLTARDIESSLLALDGKERNLSSLMAVLAKLADKGFLNPVKKFRKSTYFEPVIGENEYKAYATNQFIAGVHNGDFASLVSALVDSGQYTQHDLERLRRMLDTMSEQK